MRILVAHTFLFFFAFSAADVPSYAAAKTKKVDLGDVKEIKRKTVRRRQAKTRLTRNEAFLIATETRLRQEIVKAINYLQKTFKTLPKRSQARLQMQERLMNLRLELSVYESNAEMREYDRKWEKWDAAGGKGPEPKVSNKKSRKQWALLAKEAKVLLKDFPRSKNADTTLFNIGLAQNFLNREKDAARTFSQLIAKYPNSTRSGDAYFALGDFYFDRADFRNAMTNYKSALRFRRSRTYPYALFKLGWCHYNLASGSKSLYAKALGYWKQAVVASKRGGKKTLALKEEAMRDMVYAFAELEQIEPAIAYYRAQGGSKFIGRFLILLSQSFTDQGRFSKAIRVLKRYQQIEPTSESVPDTQKEIISLNYELGRFAKVWAELSAYPRLFGPNSRWAAKNRNNRQLYLEVQQGIKDQILYYAKLTHKNAQKNDSQKGYAEAMRGYRLFLQNYPKAKEVPEVKYNMADIEYFNKRYPPAGQLYLDIALMGKQKAVIYDSKTKKPSNIHKQSAEYMLDAYAKNFVPEYKMIMKRKPDFKKPPRPLSKRAKLFIRACGKYTKWYPKDKKNIKQCDIFIAQTFYRSNNKPQARKYLWMIAKKYPNTKDGKEAADNLIPLYKGDDQGLARAAAELLKIPAYQKGELGKKLRSLIKDLRFKNIAGIGDREKRAMEYEREYKANPKQREADKLIYNAGVDYLAAGNVSKAIAAYATVVSKHPRSEGAKDAMLKLAQLNERRLDLATAANYYQKFAKTYPKDKLAVAASAKTCQIHSALLSKSATSSCMSFARIDAEGARIEFERMMRAAFSARDATRLTNLTRRYLGAFKVSASDQVLAHSRLYYLKKGSASGSQAASQIMGIYRRVGSSLDAEALRAVGAIVFARVNGELAKFQKLKLSGGAVEALQSSIQAKTAALGKLRAAYDQVIKTKDSYWGVAALYQIGHAFELMSIDLENPPAIRGAKYSDVVSQLSGDANALKKESRDFFTLALKQVPNFSVYNDWAVKARNGLGRLEGKKVEFDDIIVQPDFLGSEVPTSVASAVKGAGS